MMAGDPPSRIWFSGSGRGPIDVYVKQIVHSMGLFAFTKILFLFGFPNEMEDNGLDILLSIPGDQSHL